ncbi:MAG: SDR family NAD(P)-dependent oxidoreductase [Bacteroidales bacterium]|nr:SDR family NAD(P)-dependent oxidoreductase [Bacteroidales bacterium]
MNGKNILITGGTSGLGLELAKLFTAKGDNVKVTGRNGASVADRESFIYADFADLMSVREAVNTLISNGFSPDIIINNAGTIGPSVFTTTKDGFEYTWQVNFISHLLLNDLLLNTPGDDRTILLVFVTSPVFRLVKPEYRLPGESEYSTFRAYAESKYFLLLTGDYLAAKYADKKLKVLKFSPGVFGSGIFRMRRPFFRALYSLAESFMPGPGRPARRLVQLIDKNICDSSKVYMTRGSINVAAPEMNESSRDFLFSLDKAINIVRRH